jgi:hypothetical protein
MKMKEILQTALTLTQSNLTEETEIEFPDWIQRANVLSSVIEGLFGVGTEEHIE